MNTDSPVRRNTTTPVTLCSLQNRTGKKRCKAKSFKTSITGLIFLNNNKSLTVTEMVTRDTFQEHYIWKSKRCLQSSKPIWMFQCDAAQQFISSAATAGGRGGRSTDMKTKHKPSKHRKKRVSVATEDKTTQIHSKFMF